MAQNGNDKEKDEGTYPGQPSSPEKDGKGNGQDKDPRPTR